MKKLWILALLPLLFVFGCSHNEYEIWDTVENFVPLSEQVQQKQNDDFEKKIMCSNMIDQLQNILNDNFKKPSLITPQIVEIFYSPIEDTCIWLVDAYFDTYTDGTIWYKFSYIYDLLTYSHKSYQICINNCENDTHYIDYNLYTMEVNRLKLKKASQ